MNISSTYNIEESNFLFITLTKSALANGLVLAKKFVSWKTSIFFPR